MIPYPIKRFLLSPTELHIICALGALVCCVPALFPEVYPEDAEHLVHFYSGTGIMICSISSAAFMVIASMVHLTRLNNIKAFGQLLRWGAVWSIAAGFFILVALIANVPSPDDEDVTKPIQLTDTLFQAHDALTGPESLVIPLETEHQQTETVAQLPHLTQLENEHSALLRDYLERSPRWQAKHNDDTFYSKPGHLVMVPPTASGTPGLVHVCFRFLTEGAPLPEGFHLIRPGDTFPEDSGDNRHGHGHITDFAVDLGRNHYLLLAWRGTGHAETMRKALNAALCAIDERMQPLAETPEPATVNRMLAGRESYAGNHPEIRLAELPGQVGAYQSEVYVNPGEAGTLLFFARDIESGQTLRLLSCPAKHSSDKGTLFRHNFPCDVPAWMRESYAKRSGGILPPDAPVFIIGTGQDHRYFGVALEVWFKPEDRQVKRHLLLRRCYRVQLFDASAHGIHPEATTGSSPDETEDEQETPSEAAPEDVPQNAPAPAAEPAPEEPTEHTEPPPAPVHPLQEPATDENPVMTQPSLARVREGAIMGSMTNVSHSMIQTEAWRWRLN